MVKVNRQQLLSNLSRLRDLLDKIPSITTENLTIQNRNIPTHDELIDCMKVLYPQKMVSTLGMCFGIAHMRRQAFLAKDSATFRERLKFIRLTLWPIVSKVMSEVTDEGVNREQNAKAFFTAVKAKLQDQFSYNQWYDLYAFFDGVILYQDPNLLDDLFGTNEFKTQNTLAAEPLLRPVAFDTNQTVVSRKPPDFSGAYTKETFAKAFNYLHNALKHLDIPVSFQISIGGHAFIIDYSQGEWLYTDANHLQEEEDAYSADKLAEVILGYYGEPFIMFAKPHLAPNVDPNVQTAFQEAITQLKQDPQWLELHEITHDTVLKKNDKQFDLLYVATEQNNIETVKQCIAAGAEPNQEYPNKATPFYLAVANGYDEIAQFLMPLVKQVEASAGINKMLKDGITPLYLAAQRGLTSLVEMLLENGADFKIPITGDIALLMDIARKINREKEFQALLIKRKIDEKIVGFTALHAALFFDHQEVFNQLLKAGASPNDIAQGVSTYELAIALDRVNWLPQWYIEQEQAKEARANRYAELNTSQFIPLLDRYEIEREERYAIKDKINVNDKQKRSEFIVSLKKSFGYLADPLGVDISKDKLLTKLEKGIKLYPGVHFRTTMYQLMLGLMEEIPPGNYAAEAEKILEGAKNPDYINKLKALYQAIEDLKQFGTKLNQETERTVIANLVVQLKQDVDYFVVKQGEDFSDKAFMAFKQKMTARIHSQDTLMSHHENWHSLALNIFLAVISVGVALGVKAAYSKWTTGQVTFFSRETMKQEKLSEVQQAMDEVSKPPIR